MIWGLCRVSWNKCERFSSNPSGSPTSFAFQQFWCWHWSWIKQQNVVVCETRKRFWKHMFLTIHCVDCCALLSLKSTSTLPDFFWLIFCVKSNCWFQNGISRGNPWLQFFYSLHWHIDQLGNPWICFLTWSGFVGRFRKNLHQISKRLYSTGLNASLSTSFMCLATSFFSDIAIQSVQKKSQPISLRNKRPSGLLCIFSPQVKETSNKCESAMSLEVSSLS